MASEKDAPWQKWDVLNKPGPIYVPHFMMAAEGFPKSGSGASEAYKEKAGEVLREHWENAVKVLKDDGYDALVTMRGRLEQKRETVKDTLERWRDRAKYVQLALTAYANPTEWMGEDAEVPEEVLDRPMGEILLSQNGAARADLMLKGWQINASWVEEPPPRTSEKWSVAYRPNDEFLKQYNLNPEHVDPTDSRTFTAADTWREAHTKLRDVHSRNADRQYFFGRTENMIAFRLNVVEAVLYRFEVFGTVEALDTLAAKEMAKEQSHTAYTPTADEILESFKENGLAECHSWETKKDLEDWALREVGVSPSTLERRLKEIDVWVTGKQGVPGSGLEKTIQRMKEKIGAD